MEIREILGLDMGAARTGVARASMVARLAEPVGVVETDKMLDYLEEKVKQKQADAVVVGLPRNLHGEETAQTAWVRDWVEAAKRRIAVPFYWQDEALTSKLAESHKYNLKSVGADALAAAIILQDWLDTPEANRVIS